MTGTYSVWGNADYRQHRLLARKNTRRDTVIEVAGDALLHRIKMKEIGVFLAHFILFFYMVG